MKQVKKVTKNLNKDIQSVTKDIQSKAKEGIEKINTELKDLKSGFERRGKIINFLIFFIVIVFAVFGHYLYTHQAVIEEFSPAFKSHHVTVGSKFRGKVKPNYPVLIIPGIVSTGLELWDGDPCAMKYFRQRMWGTMTMLNVFLRDPSCWKKHMMLDLYTGLDPKNVKLRPANGLEAADYLFPGYWVWGKVIENLGEIGYDPNNIQLESYDWRLSFANLEKRDSYFTKLKSHVELLKSTNEGKKVAMLTHSMGSLVGMYFLKWTEHNCNPGWVDEHIESFVNIGGPMLGVSKSLSTLLSGEMKDTSQFLALQSYLVDNIISPDERLYLARSWSSISSMLPKGGDKIWGNLKSAKDDIVNNYTDGSYGKFLSLYSNNEWKNLTAEESVNLLFDLLKGSSKSDDKAIAKNYNDWYSYGISTPETGFHNISEHEFEYNNTKRKFIKQEQKYWSNPLESPLPFAPNMKVYCLYGVGKDTERGYIYKTNTNYSLSIPYGLQTLYSRINEKVVSGVRLGAGDGTVPIMSLGYMCVKGWKNNFYNPSNMKVYTREYNHLPSNSFLHLRGGPGTSDHVDIMGNSELMTDVINIITGNNESDEDKITDINKEFWDNIKD